MFLPVVVVIVSQIVGDILVKIGVGFDESKRGYIGFVVFEIVQINGLHVQCGQNVLVGRVYHAGLQCHLKKDLRLPGMQINDDIVDAPLGNVAQDRPVFVFVIGNLECEVQLGHELSRPA